VNDTEAPSITCPPDQTVTTTGSGAVVNYPPPGSGDNCSVPAVVCTPPSGSFFPAGTTVVTCTATDAATNTNSCAFNVNVNQVGNSVAVDPAGRFVIYTAAASPCTKRLLFYQALNPTGTPNGAAKQLVACGVLSGDLSGIDILMDDSSGRYWISFGGTNNTDSKYLMQIDVNGNVTKSPVAVVPPGKFGDTPGATSMKAKGSGKIILWMLGDGGKVYAAQVDTKTMKAGKARKTGIVSSNNASMQAAQRKEEPDFLAIEQPPQVLKAFGLKKNGVADATSWRLSPRTDGGHETGGVTADGFLAFSNNFDSPADKLYIQLLRPDGIPTGDPVVVATDSIASADVSNILAAGARFVLFVTSNAGIQNIYLQIIDASTGAKIGGAITIQ
jgi:hypothetical protein